MKGLLLKDLLVIRKNMKISVMLIVLYFIMGIVMKNYYFSNGAVLFLFWYLVLGSFSYDEYCKWDAYAMTLPLSRKQMVLEKYLLAGVLVVLGLFLGIAVTFFFFLSGEGPAIGEVLGFYGGTLTVMAVTILIQIPLVYQFGVEKARLAIVALVVLFVIFLLNITKLEGMEHYLTYLPAVIVGVFCLMVPASFYLSCYFYEKKEF